MLRQRFTYRVHVIAESLNSFTAIVFTLLLHMFPFPYVAAEVHVMGSCKVSLNHLPTTGYLGRSEFLHGYRFYITDSPFLLRQRFT